MSGILSISRGEFGLASGGALTRETLEHAIEQIRLDYGGGPAQILISMSTARRCARQMPALLDAYSWCLAERDRLMRRRWPRPLRRRAVDREIVRLEGLIPVIEPMAELAGWRRGSW